MQPTDRTICIGDYAAPPAERLIAADFVVYNLAAGHAEAAVAGSWRTPASQSPLQD